MDEAGAPTQQELPRVLVLTSALLCGLFLALAAHIVLTAAGAGLTSAMRVLFPTTADHLKSALAWWGIGIAGWLGSWGAILLLRRTSPAQPAQRLLRVGLAIAFFCILAAAGHAASPAQTGTTVITVSTNLAAMGFGAFMAYFAAHFGSRS